MAEKIFRTIRYFEKRNINLDKFGEVEPKAREVIDSAGSEDVLVLRLAINSPVKIEAAAPLTREGIKKITLLEED